MVYVCIIYEYTVSKENERRRYETRKIRNRRTKENEEEQERLGKNKRTKRIK